MNLYKINMTFALVLFWGKNSNQVIFHSLLVWYCLTISYDINIWQKPHTIKYLEFHGDITAFYGLSCSELLAYIMKYFTQKWILTLKMIFHCVLVNVPFGAWFVECWMNCCFITKAIEKEFQLLETSLWDTVNGQNQLLNVSNSPASSSKLFSGE